MRGLEEGLGESMEEDRERAIEELKLLAEGGHECRYLEVCCTPKYSQCHNHSHVLCDNFEAFYYAERKSKGLNTR